MSMSGTASYAQPPAPAFLFDLDGTLIDSVYQHVIAWRAALAQAGIDLSVWRIHRRIGMSGGLFVSALMRETGIVLSEADIDSLQQAHAAEYLKLADSVRPLPGAAELLRELAARHSRPRRRPSWFGGVNAGPDFAERSEEILRNELGRSA